MFSLNMTGTPLRPDEEEVFPDTISAEHGKEEVQRELYWLIGGLVLQVIAHYIPREFHPFITSTEVVNAVAAFCASQEMDISRKISELCIDDRKVLLPQHYQFIQNKSPRERSDYILSQIGEVDVRTFVVRYMADIAKSVEIGMTENAVIGEQLSRAQQVAEVQQVAA